MAFLDISSEKDISKNIEGHCPPPNDVNAALYNTKNLFENTKNSVCKLE